MSPRMIPSGGPKTTASKKAEPKIYQLLREQLPDDFVVIHSLKWLSAAARERGNPNVPTGELDFVILHTELGILSAEVKGSRRAKFERHEFVDLNTGERYDPVDQVRKGTHGLARWIGGKLNIYTKIGYCVALPFLDLQGKNLPPSLEDYSGDEPQNIAIDRIQIQNIGERIIELMRLWASILGNAPLGHAKVQKIVDAVCPDEDYSPTWVARIEQDEVEWLSLSPKQEQCLEFLAKENRQVVEGRSGTGKTIIAIERARQLSGDDKKVLFLTYNTDLITEKLRPELQNTSVDITHFHGLCRRASNKLLRPIPSDEAAYNKWCKIDGPTNLHDAISQGKLDLYDALIIDEGQVFAGQWLTDLVVWFRDKPIAIFCDETQVFPYEDNQKTSPIEIAKIIDATETYRLFMNFRSPLKVFERVEEAFPAPYQQFSPRPDDTDTLEEYVEFHPHAKLEELLFQLQTQQIPRDNIVVVYTDDEPIIDNTLRQYTRKITSIYKFRGLEAPIVIVFAVGHASDETVACTYTRATSRCIVIYDARNFSPKRWIITRFIDAISKSSRRPFGLKEAMAYFEEREKLYQEASRVSNKTILSGGSIELGWSPKWAAWLIDEEVVVDRVGGHLWLIHLLSNSRYPTLHRREFSEDYSVEFCSQGNLFNAKISSNMCLLKWCNTCNKWAWHARADNQQWLCQECKTPNLNIRPPLDEVQELQLADNILGSWQTKTKSEKLSLSIHLFALAYWRTLPLNVREIAGKSLIFKAREDEIGKFSSRVLVATDILGTEVGSFVDLDDLRKKYLDWYPKLKNLVDTQIWKNWIGYTVPTWLSVGWIAKESAGKYRRLHIADVDI